MTPGELVASLLAEPPRWYWQGKASCNTAGDPDVFYPDSANQYYIRRIRQQFCNNCPVWRECLTVGWYDQYGIWGGTTPPERDAARRRTAA